VVGARPDRRARRRRSAQNARCRRGGGTARRLVSLLGFGDGPSAEAAHRACAGLAKSRRRARSRPLSARPSRSPAGPSNPHRMCRAR
jgi:hypothetical protein